MVKKGLSNDGFGFLSLFFKAEKTAKNLRFPPISKAFFFLRLATCEKRKRFLESSI